MVELSQQITNGIFTGATYALVAVGFGLTFSVLGIINFAHPDFMMLGAYVAFVVLTVLGVSPSGPTLLFLLVLLVAGALTAGFAGLVLERIVIRPLRRTSVLIPFIATAGISLVMENSAQAVFGVDPVAIPQLLPQDSLNLGGVFVTVGQFVTLALAMVVFGVIFAYLRWTRWGLATRAVAELPDVASAFGIPVTRVFQLTIGLSAAMAGVAGIAIGLLYGTAAPTMGLLFGLKSFVCMLVAGNRHLAGIVVVGLGLGILEALVGGYVTSSLRDAVGFVVLILALMARPNGLFGSYPAKRA